jgi:hypothetical protein
MKSNNNNNTNPPLLILGMAIVVNLFVVAKVKIDLTQFESSVIFWSDLFWSQLGELT